MASIEKRSDNKYRITVSCGYAPDGRKLRKHKTVTLEAGLTERQKEKEINRLAVLFEQQVNNGTYLDGEKITFGEFAEKWLTDYADKNLAPSTLHVYRMRIEKRIIPALGHIKLAKLQPHHIISFYDNLAESNMRLDSLYKPTETFLVYLKANDKRGLCKDMRVARDTFKKLLDGGSTNLETSEKICKYFNFTHKSSFVKFNPDSKLSGNTVSHHHKLLSSMLSTAVHWQLIADNPAKRVKSPEVKRKRANSYDDIQVVELFKALENAELKHRAMIYTVIYSGMRLSELSGLVWENIDFANKTITIDRQRMYISDFGIVNTDETKTQAGMRTISIPDTVLKLLREYRTECIETRLKLGNLWEGAEPGTSYVFLGNNGKAMFPASPSKWFNKFLKNNNLPPLEFHGLRHSHASILVAEGIDIVT
ncbi:site-specific integrase, partial [Tyzzerella sp. OttesenSCG-928-J15]|nr:site-specific integrase [Tyzzerella sp. OttesenSCG-928-J15]